jgi:UDP-2-acetamido-3-amino-2,3-dideoxy-glucuronate N-acetyltransferase
VERKAEFRRTLLRKGSTVGANATIVCGVEIGAYALIGAGAVIIRDVPDFAMMVGNPARQIGWISRTGEKLSFDAQGKAWCAAEGEAYQLSDGRVNIVK